jgi:hypothetical protein
MLARPFFKFQKGHHQEEHKTIFSVVRIYDMALSDQIFRLWKMTYRNFINSGIQQSAVAFVP